MLQSTHKKFTSKNLKLKLHQYLQRKRAKMTKGSFFLLLSTMALALVTIVNATATTKPTCAVKGIRLWTEGRRQRTRSDSQFRRRCMIDNDMSIENTGREATFEAVLDLDTDCEVRNVRLQIIGPTNSVRIENEYPYFLFGNEGENIHGQVLKPGSYTVIATPSPDQSKGKTVSFVVEDDY
jgi:hypothetical protein